MRVCVNALADHLRHHRGPFTMTEGEHDIATNRFKIKPGCEQDFIEIWKGRIPTCRKSRASRSFIFCRRRMTSTPRFRPTGMESQAAFEGGPNPRHSARRTPMLAPAAISTCPPQLECFEVVL